MTLETRIMLAHAHSPGVHRYLFKVYVLDELRDLKPATTKTELEKAMNTHIIAFGELVGLYKRAEYDFIPIKFETCRFDKYLKKDCPP